MAARKRKPQQSDTRTFRTPSARTIQDWTPRKIRAAERQAEGGELHSVVAICEWLLGDDDIAGALDARLDALFGLVPTFEAGQGRRKNQAIRALEAGTDWWASYPESESRLIHKWGLLLGIAPAAHQWEASEDHDGRWLPNPRFWYPQTLRQDQQTAEWSICNAQHQRLPVVPGDGTWVLHMPFGGSRPQMQGLWRSLARWALLKSYAMRDAGVHSEQSSKTVVTTPEGATYEQRRELAQDLMSSGEDAVIVLAAGFDAKRLETTANFGAIYKPLIQLASDAIRIRIRGGNLTSNVESGSHAAAKVQQESSERPKLRFDAESWSTTIHDQSLVWWAEFNFGQRTLAPWAKYPVEPEEDRQAQGITERQALEVLESAERLGLEVDREAFLEEYDIRWAKPGEKPEAPPPPPPDQFGRPQFPQSPFPPVRQEQGPPRQQGSEPVVALASGDKVPASSGFVEGQEYADALTASGAERFAEAIEPDLEAVIDVVMAAESYDDLRAKLRDKFRDLDPQQLAGVMERALILGELAGMTATLQDL